MPVTNLDEIRTRLLHMRLENIENSDAGVTLTFEDPLGGQTKVTIYAQQVVQVNGGRLTADATAFIHVHDRKERENHGD